MGSPRLIDNHKFIHAYSGTPSTAVAPYVSMKNYRLLAVVITATNGTTVTGTAVTLSQATDVSGTGAKTLAFTKAWRVLDQAAGDTLAEFTVSSNTFTSDTTNSKKLLYVIHVDAQDLDADGDFDCVKVGLGNAANTTIAAVYVLGGARDGGDYRVLPSCVVN